MSEEEHEQHSEETSEEPEETMKDLDLPAEEGEDVAGGRAKYSDIELKRG
jgi:hypothetical protein